MLWLFIEKKILQCIRRIFITQNHKGARDSRIEIKTTLNYDLTLTGLPTKKQRTMQVLQGCGEIGILMHC